MLSGLKMDILAAQLLEACPKRNKFCAQCMNFVYSRAQEALKEGQRRSGISIGSLVAGKHIPAMAV